MERDPKWQMLFQKVQQIVSDQLGVSLEEVTPRANFIDDLGADSLDFVELIMALEEKLSAKISDEDAKNMRTVERAVQYLYENGCTV